MGIFGHVREGTVGVRSRLEPIFKFQSNVAKGDKHARILSCKRTDANAKEPLDSWLRKSSIDLGKGSHDWFTVPGLFAGGTLDVMTRLLIDRLEKVVQPGAQ